VVNRCWSTQDNWWVAALCGCARVIDRLTRLDADLLDPEVIAKTPATRLAVDHYLRALKPDRVSYTKEGHLIESSCFVGDDSDTWDGLYALGDCAHVLDGNYAPIAQVAERQGLVREPFLVGALADTYASLRLHMHICR